MAPPTVKEAIQHLVKPETNEPVTTKRFFEDIATILATDKKYSVIQVHTIFVGFNSKETRLKFWKYLRDAFRKTLNFPSGPDVTVGQVVTSYMQAKIEAKQQVSIYRLFASKEAARLTLKLPNTIAYWLCYPDPSLNLFQRPSWKQLAKLTKFTQPAAGWCWDPVLIKIQDKHVSYDNQYASAILMHF